MWCFEEVVKLRWRGPDWEAVMTEYCKSCIECCLATPMVLNRRIRALEIRTGAAADIGIKNLYDSDYLSRPRMGAKLFSDFMSRDFKISTESFRASLWWVLHILLYLVFRAYYLNKQQSFEF